MKPDINVVYNSLKREVKNYKVPIIDLLEVQTKDPFKILVATILSARTNDKTTTKACEKLFALVDTLDDLEKLTVTKIQKLIYPVGFYQAKAKRLKELPKILKRDFNGKIPQTIDQLIKLPGVGRKTANLVLAVGFKIPAICVDIHMHRIMNRLGYVNTKNPLQTEMVLRKKLPKKFWLKINYLIVAYGQNLCRPVNPHCDRCPIYDQCRRVGVKTTHPKLD